MKKPWMQIFIQLLIAGSLITCATAPKTENADIQQYSAANVSASQNGCKSIMDNYCTQLYSPSASGNLFIDRTKPIQILRGETQNQLSQVYYRYSLAKIRNKKYLPNDFLSTLNKYSYFDILDDFLKRHPIQKMTLEERLTAEHRSHQLQGIWQSAIDETVISRMAGRYKGFYQIPPRLMPIEYEVEEKRIRRTLISEFSKVLWKDDANWRKVTEGFHELKASFLELFDALDIPSSVADDWKAKISSLELVLPGSLPEISDEECSTTNINAYYYKYLNIITVCAGDFNSEDIILTLAHEMSHALAIDRTLYVYLQNSALGVSLRQLRNGVCTPDATLSCSDWTEFKDKMNAKMDDFQSYRPELLDFNKCLKRAPNTKSIGDSDLSRIAAKIARNRIAGFASSDLFLRLIKNSLPMKNGKMQKNPNYLNPCSYYLWSKNEEPLDDEIYSLIFFAAEYRCSEGAGDQRLKKAIDVSQALTAPLTKAVLKLEGEFSDRTEMISEGFSSPPVERFADVLGSYAVAKYLNKFSSLWERRTKYLASTSWLCPEPSLETKFPEESKVVQEFVDDTHSLGEERRMEIFTTPIRAKLSCEKDYVFNECKLPFKNETVIRPKPMTQNLSEIQQ